MFVQFVVKVSAGRNTSNDISPLTREVDLGCANTVEVDFLESNSLFPSLVCYRIGG